MKLSLQINEKSALQKFFVIMTSIVILSAAGLSGAYAQTLGSHNGQGNQYSQHGNSTGHHGSYSGTGTFSRNGTVNSMNAFNHTKTGYSRGNNATSDHMLPQGSTSPSTSAITSNVTSSVSIPSWVKSNAKYWSEKQLADSDFISGLQYMIQQGILKVPPTAVNSTGTAQIPSWLRSNANLWSSGQISDSEFVQGIQYLITNGMIQQ
jgi:hypothetical protein